MTKLEIFNRGLLMSFLTVCKSISPCEHTCERISRTFPQHSYTGSEAAVPLWSKFQAQVRPLCRVEPRSSEDVAVILSFIRLHNCHFAVLGGGTSPFKGASNAVQGVTIDMGRMKEVSIVEGIEPQVSVGAGSLWADVYYALESRNMSATGTRNSLTGVVGSILGGGISFFSEHHGWACDTVVNFELVLANSSIATASKEMNPDLFWALKGGGNNFGIVTKVTLEVFRDPPNIYTFQLFNIDDMRLVFGRLQLHTITMPSHVWQIATTLGWNVLTQSFFISERMVASSIPDLPESVFREATDGTVNESPVLQTNIYERSILAMAKKMDVMNKEGFFNFFGSVTILNNAQLCEALAKVFQEEVKMIRDVEGLQVYIVYNPLTLNTMRNMRKRGGNALGLSDGQDPLLVVNVNLHWSDEVEEQRMRSFMRRLLERFRGTAASLQMLHPYIFQNHAFEEQVVFPGYGKVNYARLKAIRRAVDPESILGKLQPGFFKLESRKVADKWTKLEL